MLGEWYVKKSLREGYQHNARILHKLPFRYPLKYLAQPQLDMQWLISILWKLQVNYRRGGAVLERARVFANIFTSGH